uniref:Vitamin B12-dependent ribonucleotide reductase n=1 Tax=Lygus hesperus TaxID=30085 RepID=A0A0A9XDD7_LYGHE
MIQCRTRLESTYKTLPKRYSVTGTCVNVLGDNGEGDSVANETQDDVTNFNLPTAGDVATSFVIYKEVEKEDTLPPQQLVQRSSHSSLDPLLGSEFDGESSSNECDDAT